MGVYIKDMEMPETCCDCRMDKFRCLCNKPNISLWTMAKERHPNCPLISVPSQHGRLGDLDELAAGCDAPHWCRWLSEIEDAPTIIPAE